MGRRVLQEIVVEVDVGTITVRTEPARTEEEEGRTYDTEQRAGHTGVGHAADPGSEGGGRSPAPR